MAYELFHRTSIRVESPVLSIVPDGKIVLNAAATRALARAGVKQVVILWDKSNGRMAIKAATKADKNAFAVSLGHSGSLRAKSFLMHIGWTATRRETLPASWNEGEKMLEVELPVKHFRTNGNHAAEPAPVPGRRRIRV
jgi:hypothetical protein